MKTKFNNQYTRLLKPLLTGPGFTPPTGTEWEDMVYPLMWAVYKDDHKKKYDMEKKKYMSKVPRPKKPFAEYAEPIEDGLPPARTRNRVDFFTYAMIGPMSLGLHGYPPADGFDMIHGPADTVDRSSTSRRAQRQAKKKRRR